MTSRKYSTPDRTAARAPAARRVLPIFLLGGALAGAAGGCAQRAAQPYTPPPLVVDEAMQRRDWERSVAYYPNGDTVSGHNRFPVRSDADVGQNEYGPALFDIGASLAQTVALPFTYLAIPPFAKAVYTGENIGPTYTAMPPMRPPSQTVMVDGLEVDRDTLEVRQAPKRDLGADNRRYGPLGPGDTEFDSNEPVPAREWE